MAEFPTRRGAPRGEKRPRQACPALRNENYSDDERELLRSIDEFRTKTGTQFVAPIVVFRLMRQLGYVKYVKASPGA